ncbi:MADS24 [Zea mays]|uniref:MADS24 n=1 Tax=Zea mays TaxID=4577 RepID=A0A1D6L4Y9_MAIZE|nr:MADS24 [Zea mays]ONM09419.1 MADS24 [Zea mays]
MTLCFNTENQKSNNICLSIRPHLLQEQMLQDANRVLKRKLGEFEAEAASPPQLAWQGEGGMLSHDPPQPEHFFQALESNPCLQPTYHTMDMNQQPVPAPGGCYPAWMS